MTVDDRAMRIRGGREGGFTISEILVVITLIALVALIAVPNMGSFFRAYRVRTASDQLTGHLRAARQIAVTQRLPVTFTINASPANTYSFTYTIPGQAATTKSYMLPKEVTVTNTPSGALTFNIRQNGTVSNPTTPDDQSPTANYVRLSRAIGSGFTDRYTITVLAAGKVGVRFTR
jgi:Tfp pilus assembly protein FimT